MKTTDECVTEAEKWLAEAEAWKGRYGPGELDDRARMISACSDAADTWTRLAELAVIRDGEAERVRRVTDALDNARASARTDVGERRTDTEGSTELTCGCRSSARGDDGVAKTAVDR